MHISATLYDKCNEMGTVFMKEKMDFIHDKTYGFQLETSRCLLMKAARLKFTNFFYRLHS